MQHYDFAHRYLVLAPWRLTVFGPNGSHEFVTNQLHLTGGQSFMVRIITVLLDYGMFLDALGMC